ncbi:MAG: molybdate ABC transporter substrate-binding protein [Spirochaetales bacterium]|nr:molybdate ABC transporter substrate-binding protein [Spirochaetales bacterium]
MKRIYLLLTVLTFNMLVFASDERVKSVVVFNAASTTDLVDEISALFTKKTGYIVVSNPASSGTLAKQLEQGAEADIFISASEKWMNYAIEINLIYNSSSYLLNTLVLIAPIDSMQNEVLITKELDLPKIFTGRLSIGDPDYVPAGAYGKESLEYFGWYKELSSRLQPCSDVRAALAVVEYGEAELGIVYSSDAMQSKKVKIVGTFPSESHTTVQYFCGTTKNITDVGQLFYKFILEDEDVSRIYLKYGFKL